MSIGKSREKSHKLTELGKANMGLKSRNFMDDTYNVIKERWMDPEHATVCNTH